MFVFLMAGCLVVLSALLLAMGNFLCLRGGPQELATVAGETEPLTERGKEEARLLWEARPISIHVDCTEVERFLREDWWRGGDSSSETCL